MSAPLIDFLLARIDEEDYAARAAGGSSWTEQASGVLETGPWPGGVHALGDSRITRFIAEHDPARVVAESTAKRFIVEAHPLVPATDVWGRLVGGLSCETCDVEPDLVLGGYAYARTDGCKTLRALVMPYASHPDFDPTWGHVGTTADDYASGRQ